MISIPLLWSFKEISSSLQGLWRQYSSRSCLSYAWRLLKRSDFRLVWGSKHRFCEAVRDRRTVFGCYESHACLFSGWSCFHQFRLLHWISRRFQQLWQILIVVSLVKRIMCCQAFPHWFLCSFHCLVIVSLQPLGNCLFKSFWPCHLAGPVKAY